MPLYNGPLCSSPLVKKKEVLAKVGQAGWGKASDSDDGAFGHYEDHPRLKQQPHQPQDQHIPAYAEPPSAGAQQYPMYPPMGQMLSPVQGGQGGHMPLPLPVPVPSSQAPGGYYQWPMWPPPAVPQQFLPQTSSPPMAPMAPPLPPPPPALPQQQPQRQPPQHARVVSAPPTPGPSLLPGPKYGRRRPQSTGDRESQEDCFFWRLGMGEGEQERKAAQANAKDLYKRDLERQIEERQLQLMEQKRRRELDDLPMGANGQPSGNVHPTAPGERTGRGDHSYAKMRAQLFTSDDIVKQREKENQAKRLQDDLSMQIEERRLAREMEEQRRRESDKRWDNMYGANQAQTKKPLDKENTGKERVKETQAMQEEAAHALMNPKFAPLKKVYHHQRAGAKSMSPPASPPQQPVHEDTLPVKQPSPAAIPARDPVLQEHTSTVIVMEPKAKEFKLSPELQPVALPVVSEVSPPPPVPTVRFKPVPVSHPDERALDQERRIAALETVISMQQQHQQQQLVDRHQYTAPKKLGLGDDIGRMTDKNRERLAQLNSISSKIRTNEMVGSTMTTEQILKEFVEEDNPGREVDKMFGFGGPIEAPHNIDSENPEWLREVHVEQHEAFSGATLPGKSEWIERDLKNVNEEMPAWLEEENGEGRQMKQEQDDPKLMTIVTTTDAVSIPATADIDDDFCKKIFPVGARVDYKGQVGVVYRHSEATVTIYLDETGEVLEPEPHELSVVDYPPLKTTTYTPQSTRITNPTPPPSIPAPSESPLPLPIPEE